MISRDQPWYHFHDKWSTMGSHFCFVRSVEIEQRCVRVCNEHWRHVNRRMKLWGKDYFESYHSFSQQSILVSHLSLKVFRSDDCSIFYRKTQLSLINRIMCDWNKNMNTFPGKWIRFYMGKVLRIYNLVIHIYTFFKSPAWRSNLQGSQIFFKVNIQNIVFWIMPSLQYLKIISGLENAD